MLPLVLVVPLDFDGKPLKAVQIRTRSSGEVLFLWQCFGQTGKGSPRGGSLPTCARLGKLYVLGQYIANTVPYRCFWRVFALG